MLNSGDPSAADAPIPTDRLRPRPGRHVAGDYLPRLNRARPAPVAALDLAPSAETTMVSRQQCTAAAVVARARRARSASHDRPWCSSDPCATRRAIARPRPASFHAPSSSTARTSPGAGLPSVLSALLCAASGRAASSGLVMRPGTLGTIVAPSGEQVRVARARLGVSSVGGSAAPAAVLGARDCTSGVWLAARDVCRCRTCPACTPGPASLPGRLPRVDRRCVCGLISSRRDCFWTRLLLSAGLRLPFSQRVEPRARRTMRASRAPRLAATAASHRTRTARQAAATAKWRFSAASAGGWLSSACVSIRTR